MNIRYKRAHYFTLSHPLLGSGLRNYLRLLIQNRFAIDPRLSLKLVFSLITVVAWTPFRWFEALLLHQKIKKTKVQAPLIILGHPRSGTTFLHYLLAADKQMAFSNTYQVFMPRIFYFFGKYIGKMMDPMMPKKRAMDNLSMGAYKPTMDEFALANISDASWCHGFYFPKHIKGYFNKYVTFSTASAKDRSRYIKSHLWFAKKMQVLHPDKRLILKSAATSARVKELLEAFPDARFMHIYRNPYDTYQSTERLYEKILPMFGFHKVSNTFIEEYIVESYRDYHKKWFKEKSIIPNGRLIEFAFEDFITNPVERLTQAYKKLKLPLLNDTALAFGEVAKNHNSYQQNSYAELPPNVKQKLRENWEFCFTQWGYTI